MSEAVKKLTVSYGAFSCTLEGFDDPFPVMKMVVDYFQNLADRDPSFGAHPERPDSEYLRKLAQRGTNHEVEVEAQENGVILRQTGEQAAAAPASRPVTLSLVPRAEAAASDLLFPADAVVETEYVSGTAEIGSFGPATDAADAVEREEMALERLLSAARLRSGTEETLAPANPLSQLKGSLEDQPGAPRFDDAPLAGAMPMPDADFVAEFLEPEVAAAPEQPAQQEALPEAEPFVAVDEPGPMIAGTQAEPEPELVAFDAEPQPAEAAEDSPVVISMSGFAVAQVEGEIESGNAETAALIAEMADAAADTMEPMADEPMVAEAEPVAETMTDEAPFAAEEPFAEDVPASLAAANVMEEEPAVVAELPAAEPLEAVTAEESAPAEAVTEAAPEAVVATQPEPAPEAAEVAETADVSALVAPLPEFDWQAQENGNGNGHNGNGHNGNGYEAEETPAPAPLPILVLGAALRIVEVEEPVAEAVPEMAADLVPEPVAEAAPAEEIPTAAMSPADDNADDAEEDLAEPAPRRTIHRPRPEAVDFGYAAEQPDAPLAARRGAEDFDDSSITDPDALSLGKFARKVGAASLPELLEASAAYVTIVSGQPRFSRASILNMVDEISDERSYTQEARIKSFGKLLRNGSILRVEDGKFAISHSAKFNYEVKISA